MHFFPENPTLNCILLHCLTSFLGWVARKAVNANPGFKSSTNVFHCLSFVKFEIIQTQNKGQTV